MGYLIWAKLLTSKRVLTRKIVKTFNPLKIVGFHLKGLLFFYDSIIISLSIFPYKKRKILFKKSFSKILFISLVIAGGCGHSNSKQLNSTYPYHNQKKNRNVN